MQSGKLRHKIIIQKTTQTQNAYGEIVDSWSDFKTVQAEINPIGSREYFESRQINSEVTHRIIIRYISGITQKMRILFGVRIFNIESIMNVHEKNKTLNLLCIEET